MDIDYFIDTVCKTQEPLNISDLNASPIRWYISIVDYDTGRTRYVCAEDALDSYETLHATTALPIFFNQKVHIAGRRYIDGETGPVLQDHITQALLLGATKILVLNHTSPWTILPRALMHGYATWAPRGMRDAIIKDISTNVLEMSAPNTKVMVIAPKNLPAGTLTRNQKKLQETFDQGIADALAIDKELQEFFQK